MDIPLWFIGSLIGIAITIPVILLGSQKPTIKEIARAVALVRNGNIVELKRDVIEKEDGTIIVDKNKLYKLVSLEPYIIRIGRKTHKLYILDAKTNAMYRFEDPADATPTKGKLNPVMTDPRLLYNYVAGESVKKLLGKITVSKGEAILYMFTGMVIIIMLIFFILPLLGHEIIIR